MQKKTKPFPRNSHHGLNLPCLDQCLVFVPLAQAPVLPRLTPKNCYLQSKFDQIWSMSLHPCFDEGEICRFAKESLPTEVGKGRHWTSVFFSGCASNAPRFAQGQPNGYFRGLQNSSDQIVDVRMITVVDVLGSTPLSAILNNCFRGSWCLQVCSESLPTGTGLFRHQCFSVVAPATAKIRPRPAQGLYNIFSSERTS